MPKISLCAAAAQRTLNQSIQQMLLVDTMNLICLLTPLLYYKSSNLHGALGRCHKEIFLIFWDPIPNLFDCIHDLSDCIADSGHHFPLASIIWSSFTFYDFLIPSQTRL